MSARIPGVARVSDETCVHVGPCRALVTKPSRVVICINIMKTKRNRPSIGLDGIAMLLYGITFTVIPILYLAGCQVRGLNFEAEELKFFRPSSLPIVLPVSPSNVQTGAYSVIPKGAERLSLDVTTSSNSCSTLGTNGLLPLKASNSTRTQPGLGSPRQ